MTETAARLLTADEFAALPPDPEVLRDLVRGEIHSMSRRCRRSGRTTSSTGSTCCLGSG